MSTICLLRMPSTVKHRKPSFQRLQPEDRSLELLDAAATVLAERGYDAATMTEIAKKAETSIGTVYHYFKDKPAIVLALRSRYGAAMEEQLSVLEADAGGLTVEQIAHRFIEITLSFVQEHPAYFHVLDAPVKATRGEADRRRLRECIVRTLHLKQPQLVLEEAGVIANVVVQVSKGLGLLYAAAAASEREQLAREYKLLMSTYLNQHLE